MCYSTGSGRGELMAEYVKHSIGPNQPEHEISMFIGVDLGNVGCLKVGLNSVEKLAMVFMDFNG